MKTQTNLSVGAWVKVGHVQCLKSQTFSNSCAKNRHDLLSKIVGEVDGTKCGKINERQSHTYSDALWTDFQISSKYYEAVFKLDHVELRGR